MYYHVHIFIIRQFKTSSQFGMTGQMGMEEPFYNDQPIFFVVYCKYAIIVLHTTSIEFWGMILYSTMHVYSIPGSLKTPSQFGMAGQMGMVELFYNGRPIFFVVYCKYAIIALYTTSILCWGMIQCLTMRIYSISWSFKASGQFEMAGQMGMDGPFYNDRPMILQDYYKYAIISLYTTSILY